MNYKAGWWAQRRIDIFAACVTIIGTPLVALLAIEIIIDNLPYVPNMGTWTTVVFALAVLTAVPNWMLSIVLSNFLRMNRVRVRLLVSVSFLAASIPTTYIGIRQHATWNSDSIVLHYVVLMGLIALVPIACGTFIRSFPPYPALTE